MRESTRAERQRARLARRLRCYYVTDDSQDDRTLVATVHAALRGGVTAVQLRDTHRSAATLVGLGHELRALTRTFGALFIVNNRADIAKIVEADGVHVGVDDIPVTDARRILGRRAIVGATAQTPDRARQACAQGADYLGTGHIYGSRSKEKAGAPIGPEGLADVCHSVPVPVVGIGAIDAAGAPPVVEAGAAGVAVVSAVSRAEDPAAAAAEVRQAVDRSLGRETPEPGEGRAGASRADEGRAALGETRGAVPDKFPAPGEQPAPRAGDQGSATTHPPGAGEALRLLREKAPLVHHLTNYVTMAWSAATATAIGARPVMAEAPEEAGEIAAVRNALVLNTGTPSRARMRAARAALGGGGMRAGRESPEGEGPGSARAALEGGSMRVAREAQAGARTPVVLDPVGCGASAFRTRHNREFAAHADTRVIRGNRSELAALLGSMDGGSTTRGVDAAGEEHFEESAELAVRVARAYGVVAVVTGTHDAVSDGVRTVRISGGSERAAAITGTGCMLSTAIGAFLGAGTQPWESAVFASAGVRRAAANAERAFGTAGPESFRIALMDALARLEAQALEEAVQAQVSPVHEAYAP